MPLRLVVVSLEGSILKNNGRMKKSTLDVIQFVRNKGVQILFVSDRNLQTCKRWAKTLKIDDWFIAHGGSFIAKRNDDLLQSLRFSEEITYQIVLQLEQLKANVRIVHDEYTIGNRNQLQSPIIAQAVLGLREPLFYPIQFTDDLSETIRINPVSAPQIEAFFNSRETLEQAQRQLLRTISQVDVIACEDYRLLIVPRGGTKYESVRTIMDIYGYEIEETIIIAQNESEAELFDLGKFKVAMGDSSSVLKEQADWVTRTQEEDGVGYVLREVFRKQFPISFLNTITKINKK